MGFLDTFRGTAGKEEQAPAKTVVAAAMPMTGPDVVRVARGRQSATTEQWQTEAWYFFDVIGEVRSPLVWIANAVSQADLHATDLDPATGKPTGPSDDGRAQAVANKAFGGPSQRAGLLRIVALCWQVAGEAWIIIRPRGPKAGKPQPDQWLVLSGNKVTTKGEQWSYIDPYTGANVLLGTNDRLIRVWSPHPNDQSKADSSLRPALPICREIEKATQNIAARLDSRIASNGVMALAEELDFPRGDYATSSESFMAQMLIASEAGLQNPGQASAQVPLAFSAPGQLIADGGAFAHYDISTEFDGSVVELRDNGRDRLAQTIDAPKQVAAGDQGEGNHWSDWKVEEDTYKIFIEPLLKAIGDAVTEYWMVPALRTLGDTRAEEREIGWDTTAIVARPDASETLESAYDKILISDEYFRAEHGLPDDAAPNEEERTRRFLEKVVIGAPTLLADPNVATALGLNIEVSPVAAGVDAEVGAGGELEAPEPEPALPPGTGGRGLPNQGDSATEPEAVPAGLVAAAEALVFQALDRAGGRLLTNQNRGQFKDTPRHELYLHIRPTDPGALVDVRFADGVAEAFGVRPSYMRAALQVYVSKLLSTGTQHTRDELTWMLR